jgi:hypothetical protein
LDYPFTHFLVALAMGFRGRFVKIFKYRAGDMDDLFSIQETLAFYTENILSRIIDLILLVIDI